jgi:excisionase family DNA binding protein
MVSMTPQKIEGGEYLTVREAVDLMGCTEGWVRMLLGTGKLQGRRFGERVWLIPIEAAREARDNLSTRSVGKNHLAKRPVSKRTKAAKKKKK